MTFLASSSADTELRNPITGLAGCCARATTDHAAALPSPAMNSRRRILISPADRGGAYRGGGSKGTGSPSRLHAKGCPAEPDAASPRKAAGAFRSGRAPWEPQARRTHGRPRLAEGGHTL